MRDYEQLHVKTCNNLHEINKFLERLPKLTQVETENINSSISKNAIELLILSCKNKKTNKQTNKLKTKYSRLMWLTGDFYQILKKKIIQILHNSFRK